LALKQKSTVINYCAFLNLEREESFDQTPHSWKECALPLELFPLCYVGIDYIDVRFKLNTQNGSAHKTYKTTLWFRVRLNIKNKPVLLFFWHVNCKL
jgi:hypothetical protein